MKIVLGSIVAFFLGFILLIPNLDQTYAASPCDPPVTNPIVCENSKPGNSKTEWDIFDQINRNIEGFADGFSFNKGETVNFKVNTNATSYKITIYRIGYYSGQGARKITSIQPSLTLPQVQPACQIKPDVRLVDCGNWAKSASWAIPQDAVSGFYIGILERTDGTAGKNLIYFVIRDDSSNSDVLFQMPDTTYQAYNSYGKVSLYENFGDQSVLPGGPAYKVSYNRPFVIVENGGNPGFQELHSPFRTEYPFIRFLESNGYNLSYFSGMDTARFGAKLKNHKLFISSGHDEYWSGEQRTNVEAARDAGVNLAFFSGNEVFWKTRWEDSYRTLVTYKETKAGAKIDPSPLWTGTWRDPRFSPPSDGGRPENALTGTIFMVNGSQFNDMSIPYEYTQMRLWRNTSIAQTAVGQTAVLPYGILGFEWDEDIDNGSRPAGLVRYSLSTHQVEARLTDHGVNTAPGIATHSATLYKVQSGAKVFGAGTIEWAWGLDNENHMRSWEPVIAPDIRIKQATVNLLADLGVQPSALQTGLVAATASTDDVAPTSTISSPPNNSNFYSGTEVTVTGTASDSKGVVGGVEVSTDNGTTWHPANGLSNWTYKFTPTLNGQITLKTRAVDDSGNLGAASPGVTLNINSPTVNVYRLYLNSTRRFWTTKQAEIDLLVNDGWINEGLAFSVPAAPASNIIPVYRLYYDADTRFWTTNQAEVNLLVNDGWINEGMEFYARSTQSATSLPVYRLYLDNITRFWTTNQAEVNLLVNDGWINEGIVFYTQ